MKPGPVPWRTLYGDFGAHLGIGLVSGMICGFLLGGVGGRVAMLVLRLTSDTSLHGAETDDGFIIGAVTADSFFLLLAATFLGGAGGLGYLVIRTWLPTRFRAPYYGLLAGTAGGALVIRPGGTDFTLLEPLSLAVAMFIALPAVFGVSVSLLTEVALRRRWGRARYGWLPALPLVMVLGAPPAAGVLAVAFIAVGANRHGRVTELWQSNAAAWGGRLCLTSALLIAAVLLVRDVTTTL